MEDRGFNYDQFVERVGNDPDDPVTPKERLAENTINLRGDHISKGTVYRWLAQMKWEMTNAAT